MRNTIEILAPAGNEEMLSAAVYSGADAVYLGFTRFNARRSAGNFTPDRLAQAVRFCHARGVKVNVTLNTTLYAGELEEMAQCIREVAAAGADAVILQDLATAALARDIAPALARHASTQLTVHSLSGALQAAEMGFTRVILARELTLAEIEHITKHCGIETEVFVHGALCMSVSGQCYMSAFLGGRSGNRGSCAGPCRLPFDAQNLPAGMPGQEHHLSLKDQSLIEYLPRFQEMGVASAKIEGRLRPPEYVAAAVNACLLAREGKPYDKTLLESVFSRSGFTKGYLEGKIDRTMFGTRTQEDTARTRESLPGLRELYRRERPRVPVRFTVELDPDGVKVTAADGEGNRASAYSEAAPQPAQKDQAPAIEKALSKTGGTPFLFEGMELTGEPGAPSFLPAAQWNELRRQVLEKLLALRSTPRPIPVAAYTLPAFAPRPALKGQALAARFESWDQIPREWAEKLTYFQLPIALARKVPPQLRKKVVLELPRVMFGAVEASLETQIKNTRDQGFLGYEVNNLGQFRLAKGLPLFGGMGLNITNPLSALEAKALGCKSITLLPEVTLSDMETITPGIPVGVVAYGHLPLMFTRACPLKNVTDCDRCSKAGTLTDRKAKKFPVRCGLGIRTIYNPVPLYMGDKPLPGEIKLAWFTLETREEAAAVLEDMKARRPFAGEFTRGLYYKGTN